MRLQWHIGRKDVARVRALIREQCEKPRVRRRKSRNLAKSKPPIRREVFWRQMVRTRLTSVQRVGPDTPVGKFNNKWPFPLSYRATRAARRRMTFIAQTLKQAGGIRFVPKIAEQLAQNFKFLEDGGWEELLGQCNRLTRAASREVEREVAHYIADKFKGFGPKQSRNLLQGLGLTRYETPIDSRVTKWLNEFGFPIHLSADALADRDFYEFVAEGIQELCARAGVYPCVLDAAIFSSRDSEEGFPDREVRHV